jgi:DNA-binding XRE family transcriptional regulator
VRCLREVRAAQRMSARDLARHAGVAPSTIYMIEAGRSVPHLSVVRRIVDVLRVEAVAVSEFRHAICVYSSGR